jgi:molybdopterin synthase catalytic subunit
MHQCEVKVTKEPLPPVPCVFSTEHGAVVDFFGVVRETENEATIAGLDYEAFVAMAEAELAQISEETARKFSLGTVIVHHRIGFVAAGEASLFVRVSARHRGAAFAGSQQLIELLKARVPIWKHPIPATTPLA